MFEPFCTFCGKPTPSTADMIDAGWTPNFYAADADFEVEYGHVCPECNVEHGVRTGPDGEYEVPGNIQTIRLSLTDKQGNTAQCPVIVHQGTMRVALPDNRHIVITLSDGNLTASIVL